MLLLHARALFGLSGIFRDAAYPLRSAVTSVFCQIQIEVRSTARMVRTSYRCPYCSHVIGCAAARPKRYTVAHRAGLSLWGDQHVYSQWQARAAGPEPC